MCAIAYSAIVTPAGPAALSAKRRSVTIGYPKDEPGVASAFSFFRRPRAP